MTLALDTRGTKPEVSEKPLFSQDEAALNTRYRTGNQRRLPMGKFPLVPVEMEVLRVRRRSKKVNPEGYDAGRSARRARWNEERKCKGIW